MHRRPLVEMLARYRLAFPGEADVVDRILALVEGHADCFHRSCRPGHVTGSAWIVSPDRRQCLLTHHGKLDRWLQLGGHADGQSHIDEVALREAREESGMSGFDLVPINGSVMPLDVDVHQIPARFDSAGHLLEDAHEHHDVRFLLIAHAGQPIRASDESHQVAWFTPDEVQRLTYEESVLRMLYKSLTILS
jgi:8-oxo-dGTP pyrophosphatase MutT (NUDIX family)